MKGKHKLPLQPFATKKIDFSMRRKTHLVNIATFIGLTSVKLGSMFLINFFIW
jgi:hypothetical protein